MEKKNGLFITLPKKGIFNLFIFNDIHSLFHDPRTLSLALQHLAKLPEDSRDVVINGDLFDFDFLMRGNRNPLYSKFINSAHGIEDYFLPEWNKEMEFGDYFFDFLINRLNAKIIYLEGNHEYRLKDFLQDCPVAYRGNFNLASRLNFKKRKITHLKYNDWINIGNELIVTHGYLVNKNCLEHFVRDFGYIPVAVGHLHKEETRTFNSHRGKLQAHLMPCMCNKNPDYLKGKPNSWVTGHTRAMFIPEGLVSFRNYLVNHNMTILDSGERLVFNETFFDFDQFLRTKKIKDLKREAKSYNK